MRKRTRSAAAADAISALKDAVGKDNDDEARLSDFEGSEKPEKQRATVSSRTSTSERCDVVSTALMALVAYVNSKTLELETMAPSVVKDISFSSLLDADLIKDDPDVAPALSETKNLRSFVQNQFAALKGVVPPLQKKKGEDDEFEESREQLEARLGKWKASAKGGDVSARFTKYLRIIDLVIAKREFKRKLKEIKTSAEKQANTAAHQKAAMQRLMQSGKTGRDLSREVAQSRNESNCEAVLKGDTNDETTPSRKRSSDVLERFLDRRVEIEKMRLAEAEKQRKLDEKKAEYEREVRMAEIALQREKQSKDSDLILQMLEMFRKTIQEKNKE